MKNIRITRVLVCIRMYSYVSVMLVVCIRMLVVCQSYVIRMLVVCIRMYSYVPYVTRMLLVVPVWCFSHDLPAVCFRSRSVALDRNVAKNGYFVT